MTFLVIDDRLDVLDTANEVAQSLNVALLTCSSFETHAEAMLNLNRKKIQAAFIDIFMPANKQDAEFAISILTQGTEASRIINAENSLRSYYAETGQAPVGIQAVNSAEAYRIPFALTSDMNIHSDVGSIVAGWVNDHCERFEKNLMQKSFPDEQYTNFSEVYMENRNEKDFEEFMPYIWVRPWFDRNMRPENKSDQKYWQFYFQYMQKALDTRRRTDEILHLTHKHVRTM